MKTFRLSGTTANWEKGLRMTAINLSTLAKEISTTFDSRNRMYVSVANNIFHVADNRREIIKGEISENDKNNILATLKKNTPDFLLTLDDKVVGYASLLNRATKQRVNEPTLDAETEHELICLECKYENSDMTEDEYRSEKEEIVSDFFAKFLKPTDGAILIVAELTPRVAETEEKHSFKKHGLTEVQEQAVCEEICDILHDWGYDGEDASEICDKIADDVFQNIVETADWETYADNEINEDDVLIAVRRVLYDRLTA